MIFYTSRSLLLILLYNKNPMKKSRKSHRRAEDLFKTNGKNLASWGPWQRQNHLWKSEQFFFPSTVFFSMGLLSVSIMPSHSAHAALWSAKTHRIEILLIDEMKWCRFLCINRNPQCTLTNRGEVNFYCAGHF